MTSSSRAVIRWRRVSPRGSSVEGSGCVARCGAGADPPPICFRSRSARRSRRPSPGSTYAWQTLARGRSWQSCRRPSIPWGPRRRSVPGRSWTRSPHHPLDMPRPRGEIPRGWFSTLQVRVLTALFHRHLEPGTEVEDSSTMATATAAKTKLKIFPLADRVAIRPMEETETMKGGLYIPDTAKEKPIQGEVIAVGPGRREKDSLVPMELKVGDRVVYGKYSGTQVELEGEEIILIKESDVIAKLG